MDPAALEWLKLAAATEPKERTILDYVFNPDDYCMPANIRASSQFHDLHRYLAEAVYVVVQSLVFFHGLRSQRFFAMCPERKGPIFDKHVASLRRLKEWEEQTDPVNPTLAPGAKIPAVALGFHLDQRAYDAYASLYLTTLQKFHAIEWSKYSRIVKNMESAASQYLAGNDYVIWRSWWKDHFKPAMEEWHIYMEDVNMPSWEDTVDELYDLIVKCVDDSEDMTAAQLAQGLCSCQIKSS
jgi:hypothetical protein